MWIRVLGRLLFTPRTHHLHERGVWGNAVSPLWIRVLGRLLFTPRTHHLHERGVWGNAVSPLWIRVLGLLLFTQVEAQAPPHPPPTK